MSGHPYPVTGPDLAAARRRVGLHRLGLAQLLKISPRLVAAWEQGDTLIPARAAESIAAALWTARLAQAQRDRERLERLTCLRPLATSGERRRDAIR